MKVTKISKDPDQVAYYLTYFVGILFLLFSLFCPYFHEVVSTIVWKYSAQSPTKCIPNILFEKTSRCILIYSANKLFAQRQMTQFELIVWLDRWVVRVIPSVQSSWMKVTLICIILSNPLVFSQIIWQQSYRALRIDNEGWYDPTSLRTFQQVVSVNWRAGADGLHHIA